MSSVGQGMWMCHVCDYVSRSTNTFNHIEFYHMPQTMTYNCTACDKTFKTRNSFNVHKSTYHKSRQSSS